MHVSIHWTQVAPAARQPIVTRLWFCHAMEWKCVMNDETSRQIERQIHTHKHISVEGFGIGVEHAMDSQAFHQSFFYLCTDSPLNIWTTIENANRICTVFAWTFNPHLHTNERISCDGIHSAIYFSRSLKNKTLYIVWQVLDFSFILNENLL